MRGCQGREREQDIYELARLDAIKSSKNGVTTEFSSGGCSGCPTDD